VSTEFSEKTIFNDDGNFRKEFKINKKVVDQKTYDSIFEDLFDKNKDNFFENKNKNENEDYDYLEDLILAIKNENEEDALEILESELEDFYNQGYFKGQIDVSEALGKALIHSSMEMQKTE